MSTDSSHSFICERISVILSVSHLLSLNDLLEYLMGFSWMVGIVLFDIRKTVFHEFARITTTLRWFKSNSSPCEEILEIFQHPSPFNNTLSRDSHIVHKYSSWRLFAARCQHIITTLFSAVFTRTFAAAAKIIADMVQHLTNPISKKMPDTCEFFYGESQFEVVVIMG